MDEIWLSGLRVVGTHGVLAEEQTRAQPFEIDLVLSVDLAQASVTDDLADTVDYGAVSTTVERIVREEHFALLERLGGRIANAVLDLDPRIDAVTVTVTKVRPPVAVDLATAGVTLHRERGGG